jgi:hypothetical protein
VAVVVAHLAAARQLLVQQIPAPAVVVELLTGHKTPLAVAQALLWCVTLSCVSAWLPQAALLPHTPLAGSSLKPTHLHQAPISAWLSWAL